MTPIQQAIAILEEDALTNRIERALEVLRGVPQSPITRDAVLTVVMDSGNCGIGDTGPDGKWRRIACNDEKLKGDRHCYFEDCDCSKIADGIVALLDTRPDREGK